MANAYIFALANHNSLFDLSDPAVRFLPYCTTCE